jgi:type II secretory pathway pseudopilin PulG
MLLQMMRKNSFTLLEILIAITLLALVGTVIGVRTSQAIDAKEFQSSIEGLRHQIETIREMAFHTQADWWVEVEMKGRRMNVQAHSPETGSSSSWERPVDMQLFWNREAVQKMTFYFSASGKIRPNGMLEFRGKKKSVEWRLPELFHATEGRS